MELDREGWRLPQGLGGPRQLAQGHPADQGQLQPRGEPDAPATYVVDDPSFTRSSHYCVWVFATDRYGAVDVRPLSVAPTDNPPVVTVFVTADPGKANAPTASPFPAYSTFQLSALATDADEDPLTYKWSLDQRPAGSTVDLIPCPGNNGDSDTLRCFTADQPGTFRRARRRRWWWRGTRLPVSTRQNRRSRSAR